VRRSDRGKSGLLYPAIYEIWKWHFHLKGVLAAAVSSTVQGEAS